MLPPHFSCDVGLLGLSVVSHGHFQNKVEIIMPIIEDPFFHQACEERKGGGFTKKNYTRLFMGFNKKIQMVDY